MKKHFKLFLIFGLILFTRCHTSKRISIQLVTDELAKEIFKALINDDYVKVNKLVFTSEEISSTINKSNMNENKKKSFLDMFTEKMNSDREETLQTIKQGYSDIRANIESKKCSSKIEIVDITSTIRFLENIPIEIGKLQVRYACEKDIETFEVEIIKTSNGWRILENLRLIQY